MNLENHGVTGSEFNAGGTTAVLALGDGPSDAALEVMPRADIAKFTPMAAQLREALTRAKLLTISNTDTPERQAQIVAEAARLRTEIFAPIRRAAERLKTELKEGIVKTGREIDEKHREIRNECNDAESFLRAIELFPEEERRRKENDLRASRLKEIAPYLTGPVMTDIAALSEPEWQKSMDDAKRMHAQRMQEEAAAAAERQKREEEERVRREEEARRAEEQRVELEQRRAEIARLKKMSDENEAKRLVEIAQLKQEQAEKDRQANEERRAAELRSAEQMRALERQNREREEAQRREREAREAAIAEERRVERERAAAEADRERAAAAEARRREAAAAAELQKAREAKAEQERAEAAARRAAEAAPDVEKIRAFANVVATLPAPALSDRAGATAAAIRTNIANLAAWLNKKAAEMEGGQQS